MSRGATVVLVVFAVAMGLMYSGCGRKTTGITVAGSTAFQPFAEELAEKYMSSHPGVTVTVQGGGSIVGIQSVNEGAADIGMADLLTLPPESTGAMKSVVVAKDGIAIIVNPACKATGITMEQARGIFGGKISSWKSLGGDAATINVISREEGSGTRKSFEQLVLKDVPLAGNALFQDSNGTIRQSVAGNPNAIGYISTGFVDASVKALKLDGVAATNGNVIKGTYPLVRPVYFLTRGEPSGSAQEFIAYVLSEEGQNLIKEKGLIPVSSK